MVLQAEKTCAPERMQVKEQTSACGSLTAELADRITAVVGLKESVTSENRIIRYLWTTIFVIALGATAFYLIKTVQEYVDSPSATSVQLSSDPNHAFPPLLLCPPRWFDAGKAYDMGLSTEALKYSLSYIGAWFEDRFDDIGAARQEFIEFYKARNYVSLLDFYLAIGQDLPHKSKNATASTWYHCRDCLFPSDANDTVNRTILEDRICYIFHMKPIEAGFGAYSGWRVIEIQYQVKTGGLLEDSEDWHLYFSPWPDVHVTVHPKLTVSTFRRYVVKLNIQQFESLDRSERPCRRYIEGDSSTKCMIKCHNAMYREARGCGLPWLELTPLDMTPQTTCNRADRIPPGNLTLQEFFKTAVNKRIDEIAATDCVKRCPPECTKMIYETILLIQENYLESEKKRALDANVSILEVQAKHGNVYQGGMVMSREMYIYSFTQLLNNIGGTLGLFVGGTLLTLVQLVLFFVNYTLVRNKGQ